MAFDSLSLILSCTFTIIILSSYYVLILMITKKLQKITQKFDCVHVHVYLEGTCWLTETAGQQTLGSAIFCHGLS